MKVCTVVVLDEVNCKITGLELSTRKKLSGKFKYIDHSKKYTPAVRLGRWDGSVTFFTMGGMTYINLLAEILPILEAEGYDIELEDARDYQSCYELEPIAEDSFARFQWPDWHSAAGQPVMLRDYQVEVINNFLQNPQALGQVATGAGKTIMTAALSQRCEQHGRTIVIVPNKSLVIQTERNYRAIGLDVGVFFGDRKEFGRTHTICTWQSLNILLKNTRNQEALISIDEFIAGVVCVMVDECHQVRDATALRTLLTQTMSRVPIRWGLTGTVPREDFNRVTLEVSLGPVVHRLQAHELQEQGVLANCHINMIQFVDTVEFKDYQQELKYLLDNDERQVAMAAMIQKIAQTGNTLVLIDRVKPGQALAAMIPGAVFLSGSTKNTDRQLEYEGFATADNKIAFATFGIAAVGIDIPRIFNLVLIEPGKSFVKVIQSIGRGIRRASDKDSVNIYDLASTCKFSRRHLAKRKQYYNEARYPNSLEKYNWRS